MSASQDVGGDAGVNMGESIIVVQPAVGLRSRSQACSDELQSPLISTSHRQPSQMSSIGAIVLSTAIPSTPSQPAGMLHGEGNDDFAKTMINATHQTLPASTSGMHLMHPSAGSQDAPSHSSAELHSCTNVIPAKSTTDTPPETGRILRSAVKRRGSIESPTGDAISRSPSSKLSLLIVFKLSPRDLAYIVDTSSFGPAEHDDSYEPPVKRRKATPQGVIKQNDLPTPPQSLTEGSPSENSVEVESTPKRKANAYIDGLCNFADSPGDPLSPLTPHVSLTQPTFSNAASSIVTPVAQALVVSTEADATSAPVVLHTATNARGLYIDQALVSVAAPIAHEHANVISSTALAVQISQKMTFRLPIANKPAPIGQPEVWAERRQDLCETLPYFKSYQGGCYQKDGHIYSFFFDAGTSERDYMDFNTIIARSGGSMGSDSDNASAMVQVKDHSMKDSQVQAFISGICYQNPLVVICGDRNKYAQCRMPHTFCVLGWYKPTLVWAEKTRGRAGKTFITIKYRVERLGAASRPWHAPAESALSQREKSYALSMPLVMHECATCKRKWPRLYLAGWMCLDPGCESFWLMDGEEPDLDKLDYDPAFLVSRTSWTNEELPYDLRPRLPVVGQTLGDNLTYINTRGMWCQFCGRCNSRRLFKGWSCDNPACSNNNFPLHLIVPPSVTHNAWSTTGVGPTLSRNVHLDAVTLSVEYVSGLRVNRYTVSGLHNCHFLHIVANATTNALTGGADDMFAALQTQDDPAMDLGLERRGLHTKGPREMLMSAFSTNFGFPYKFVASVASQPFDDAPWPINAARADLNFASQEFMGQEGHQDLNEELVFAYLEGQKIDYHDDGESGLGPRIATLSLGGKAKMYMRMKAKHFLGYTTSKESPPKFVEDKPLPCCAGGADAYEKRLAAWGELQILKAANKSAYAKRCSELSAELQLDEVKPKKSPDLLTITLSHGDIVIMSGYDMQRYLEHKVVPENGLRFALTCRTVLPGHLKPNEMPDYDVGPDKEDMSSLRRFAAGMTQAAAPSTSSLATASNAL